MCPLYHSSPQWVGEANGKKKKAKLICWDKDSLKEQQRKQTVTTIILIRRMYKKTTNGIHRAILSQPDAQHATKQ